MDSSTAEALSRFNSARMREMQTQPPYNALITPERTSAVMPQTFVNRDNMIRGVMKMWEMIMATTPQDPKHQEAINKLRNVQRSLSEQYRALQQKQAQAQAMANGNQQGNTAQRPSSQHMQAPPATNGPRPQQAQAQQPPQTQSQQQPQQQQQQQPQQQQAQAQQQASQAPRPTNEPPPQYVAQAANVTLLVPASVTPEAGRQIVNETRKKLAVALWRQKQIQDSLMKCSEVFTQARNQGKDPPQDVMERKKELDKNMNDVRTYMSQIKQQQEALKNSGNGFNPMNDNSSLQSGQSPQQAGNVNHQMAQQRAVGQQPSNNQNQNSAQQAARAPSAAQVQGVAAGQPGQPPRPSLTQNNPDGSYTHAEAMTAVNKSYSSAAQATPQQSQNQASAQTPAKVQESVQAHQTKPDPERQDRPSASVPKTFPVQPPTPVNVGPSRPTMMAPNNGPPGALGQPAITQVPTYNLHGQGDHVLERGKLHELVRQVTGAGDGAVGEHQGLQPEVEESMLMLADEFLDNVVTAACKLAKLRGSQTLDLRDIQLVLERQYNIRIPGYGLDEVRTVRKVQPAPAYYQKLNAINAAKVVGKTSDV